MGSLGFWRLARDQPDWIAAIDPDGTEHAAGDVLAPVNWHYTGPEVAYILRDCEAKAFFADSRYAAQAVKAAEEAQLPAGTRFSYGELPGFLPVADLRSGQPDSRPGDRTGGVTMHYTSGTTGRPKGVRRELSGLAPDDLGEVMNFLLQLFGITAGEPNVHLVTSPNYHTAVTQFGSAALHMGQTLIYMDKWDPATNL